MVENHRLKVCPYDSCKTKKGRETRQELGLDIPADMKANEADLTN